MKRALLIVLLSFGTVAGFASGIHQLRHGCPHSMPEPCSCRCARPAPAPPGEAPPPPPQG